MGFDSRILAAAILAACLTGCNHTGRPHFFGGESHAQKVQDAIVHDPYPEPETGPPIDEARPPGFEHNVAEPYRARWWQRMNVFQ